MELTEQSLTDAILSIKQSIRDRAEIMSMRPTHMLVRCDLIKWADRLLNPWKGKRAKWLASKR